jgi:hypothetical protein
MEHIFLLAYYLGFTKCDIEAMPIQHRIWYIKRVQQEINSHAEKSPDGAHTKGAHDNSQDARAFRGQRPETPARLRRFT